LEEKEKTQVEITLFYYNLYSFQPPTVSLDDSQMVFVSDFGLNVKFGKRFHLAAFEIEAILREKAVEFDDVLFSKVTEAEDELFEYRTGDLSAFYESKKKLKFFKRDMQNLEYGFYFPLNVPFEYFK
jgi:hypothetical protein